MVTKSLIRTTFLAASLAACGGEPAPQPVAPAAPAPAPEAQPAPAPAPGEHAHHGAHHGEHHPGHDGDHQCGVVGHRFEDAEEWAKRFDDPDRDAWQKPAEVIRVMAITPGATVADIGAGTGYFMPHLAKAVGAGGKVLSLDIEPDMVRYMKDRATKGGLANVEVRQVEPADPGLAAASVDRILVVDTWHHIGDREAYAAHLKQALRPGGAVYIVDFTMETRKGPPPEHRLAPEAVIAELEAAGLQAELVADESLPDQYIVRARAQGR